MVGKKTVWIGCLIIALAAVIVVMAVLMPRLLKKDDMRDLLQVAIRTDAQYVYLNDPQFVHEDVLSEKGKEVKLTGETLSAVRSQLDTLSDHFSFRESKEGIAGFDLHLLVKTADGKTVKIYFTDTCFYWCEYSTYHYFAPKDEEAYAALLQQLRTCINA